MTFERLLPLLLLAFTGLTALLGRSLWQRYRYGSWGWSVERADEQERPVQLAGLVLAGALVAQALLWAADILPATLWVFTPRPATEIAGCALAISALVVMAVAQLQMGSSWRIGIDAEAKPGLIRHGLYRFSRNPIYLAIFLALAGFALLVPTWLSLGLLVGAVLTTRAQVQQEELYLLRSYGDAFRAYQRRVGRFVPLIGRVR